MVYPAEIFVSSIKLKNHTTAAIMKMASDVVQNVRSL
jgi:hypothetical protein